MTVDVTRLPTLKLGSRGPAVKAAKMGVNKWNAKEGNTVPLFGVFFRALVKRFQTAHLIPASGVIGPATWKALMPHMSAAAKALLPQVPPKIPNLGPIVKSGKSVLDHDLTHATAGISLYPAFDDAFGQGVTVIAPEALTVTRKSHSNPGFAFYATGASGLRYWFAHLTATPAVGTKYRKGSMVGRTCANHVGGGPHCHVGVNVEKLWGAGKQFSHHVDYTHGGPTIRQQLLVHSLL